MVVYYSFSGTTRKYAEALSALVKDSTFELQPKKKLGKTPTIIVNCFKSLTKASSTAEKLPNVAKDRIVYLCTPIVAGNIPPVVRYFINSTDFTGKKVNLIITCASASEAETYKKNVVSNFVNTRCKIGFAQVFVNDKRQGDNSDVIVEQLKEIVLNFNKVK